MDLTFALVFSLCISLLSCQSIKNVKVDPGKDVVYKQSTPAETNNQKILLDKISYLRVPLSKTKSKYSLDGPTLESKTEKQNSVPFVTMEKPHEKVLYRVDLEPNTGNKKDNIEINEELLFSNSQKEGETKNEVILEEVKTKDNDVDTRGVIPPLSKDDKGNEREENEREEELHHKEELKHKDEQLELKNDLKRTTVCNPELCKAGIQHVPGYKSEINVNEDDHKANPISFVLNKYVFG